VSQENVEIVRRIYDALNREDSDAVFRTPTRTSRSRSKKDPEPGHTGGAKPYKGLWTICEQALSPGS
jgi:hypothetical protein